MRVTLLAFGTRGDAQPMSVLGSELQRRGHIVRLASSPGTHDIPQAFDLTTLPLGRDMREMVVSEEGAAIMMARSGRKLSRAVVRALYDGTSVIRDAIAACSDSDVIIASWLTQHIAEVIAAQRRVPLVAIQTIPVRPSRAVPHPLSFDRDSGSFRNWLSGANLRLHWRRAMRGHIQLTRALSGFRGRTPPPALEIQAFDHALVPALPSEQTTPIVGSLIIPGEVREALGETDVDDVVVRWIQGGEAPVLYGFGSMPVGDPHAVMQMIERVAHETGTRAIVSSGWGGLSAAGISDDRILAVGAVNHELLMPMCAAVVHHGGAGTTAASSRAGIPAVICSVSYDQPFWGGRIAALGSGTTFEFSELDYDRLLQAVTHALAEETRARARLVGHSMRRDAVQSAADLIESAVR
ncbi:glycosyltransferase [Microbacterium sp. A8/3-1]|uniref:Glycosyltransferase n=1 Tax=Microbacterium sp. A8/3-1 TaxID=3160749 RepID=A0AAU7W468_9MICO